MSRPVHTRHDARSSVEVAGLGPVSCLGVTADFLARIVEPDPERNGQGVIGWSAGSVRLDGHADGRIAELIVEQHDDKIGHARTVALLELDAPALCLLAEGIRVALAVMSERMPEAKP